VIGADAWNTMRSHAAFIVISAVGLTVAAALALRAWAAARDQVQRALWLLLLAYCALLVAPASQAYRQVDTWQDLASTARAIGHDTAGKPLILFAPDETSRAMIDMYARTTVELVPGPIDAAATEPQPRPHRKVSSSCNYPAARAQSCNGWVRGSDFT
jgi:hypothetical protein